MKYPARGIEAELRAVDCWHTWADSIVRDASGRPTATLRSGFREMRCEGGNHKGLGICTASPEFPEIHRFCPHGFWLGSSEAV